VLALDAFDLNEADITPRSDEVRDHQQRDAGSRLLLNHPTLLTAREL
jgi:hypothetical protein